MVRYSIASRRRSEDSSLAVVGFVVLTIGVGVLVWFAFFRQCDAGAYAPSGSVSAVLSSEKVAPAEQRKPAQMPSSLSSSETQPPASAAPTSVDTTALTPAQADSVMATAPQRAAAFQAAVNADFGPGCGPLSVAAIASQPIANPEYAAMVSAEHGTLGAKAQKMMASSGPRLLAPDIDATASDAASASHALGTALDALSVFPKNVGMSAQEATKQEDMMRMPQTETWKMTKEQEDSKRAENSIRAALAAADPMRAAAITASMGPINPITLRSVLAAQRGTVAVRPESSRLGVGSHVAGPTLAVRMGLVAPAASPVVTGEGLTSSTQIHETVARFNRSIASEAAKCASI